MQKSIKAETCVFSNMNLGPLVSIEDPKLYKSTYEDLLDRGLIPIAYITDPTHESFKLFIKQPERIIPVGVFITIKYIVRYD